MVGQVVSVWRGGGRVRVSVQQQGADRPTFFMVEFGWGDVPAGQRADFDKDIFVDVSIQWLDEGRFALTGISLAEVAEPVWAQMAAETSAQPSDDESLEALRVAGATALRRSERTWQEVHR